MGLGVFTLWNLLRRGRGVVDVSGDIAVGRSFPMVDRSRGIRKCMGVAGFRRIGRYRGVDRAGGSCRHPAPRPVYRLAAITQPADWGYSNGGGCPRDSRGYVGV